MAQESAATPEERDLRRAAGVPLLLASRDRFLELVGEVARLDRARGGQLRRFGRLHVDDAEAAPRLLLSGLGRRRTVAGGDLAVDDILVLAEQLAHLVAHRQVL